MKQLVQRSLHAIGYEIRRYPSTIRPVADRSKAPAVPPPATETPKPPVTTPTGGSAPVAAVPSVDKHGDAFLAQRELLRKLGVRRPTILDVGANTGQTAVRYIELFPDSPIYSFEPFPEAFHQLVNRVRSAPNVMTINKAVSDVSRRQRETYSARQRVPRDELIAAATEPGAAPSSNRSRAEDDD